MNISPIERNKIIMRSVRESIVASSQFDLMPHLEAIDALREIGEHDIANGLMNRFDEQHKVWEALEKQRGMDYEDVTGAKSYGF